MAGKRTGKYATVICEDYTHRDILMLCYAAGRRATDKNVPIMAPIDNLLNHVLDMIATHGGACQCCGVAFKPGKAGVACHASMTLHRITPSAGYVAGNLALVCYGCNTDIGECHNLAFALKRKRALDWQIEQMEKRP